MSGVIHYTNKIEKLLGCFDSNKQTNKMGCTDSNQSSYHCDDDWDSAKQRAVKMYNYRINHYNPSIHGPYNYYMFQVEAEYELTCIPEYYRRGHG